MKKVIKFLSVLFLAGIMVSTVSCSSDDGGSSSGLSNSWKVGNKTYTQFMCIAEEHSGEYFTLTAMDSSFENVFLVNFKNRPTAGAYTIVVAGSSSIGDNEVAVGTAEGLSGGDGEGNPDRMDAIAKEGTVTVEVLSDGKLKITVGQVEAYYGEHGTPIGESGAFTTIEGSITETDNPFGD